MSASSSNVGIYNDIDNEWILYAARNAATTMYYNGAAKIATTNTGINVT